MAAAQLPAYVKQVVVDALRQAWMAGTCDNVNILITDHFSGSRMFNLIVFAQTSHPELQLNAEEIAFIERAGGQAIFT